MVFELMSNLRATAGTSNNEYCTLLGYHAVNDGGGGDFYWDAASTESDNLGTIIAVNPLVPGRWKRIFNKVVSVKWFGAKGDPAYDELAFKNALETSDEIRVPAVSGGYQVPSIKVDPGKRLIGAGADVWIQCLSNTAIPNVIFLSNTYIEHIGFKGNPNQENNRASVEEASNISVINCRFEGFTDNVQPINAWGFYIKESKNILLRDCSFANNSQSDIAILEGSENITIINASGPDLHLNIEPNNGAKPIKNIALIGGSYAMVELNEGDLLNPCTLNFSATAVSIGQLRYSGATAKFNSCRIQELIQEFVPGYTYGGSVDFGGSIGFGRNMLLDPCIQKLGTDVNDAMWLPEYITTNQSVTRMSDNTGSFIRLNPNHEFAVVALKHKAVPLYGAKKYGLVVTSKAQYLTGTEAAFLSFHITLRWMKEVAGIPEPLLTKEVHINRGQPGKETALQTFTAILTPPQGATLLQVIISNTSLGGFSNSAVDFYKIGLHELSYPQPIDNSHVITNTLVNRDDEKFYTSGIPTAFSTGTSALYQPGMKLYNQNIISGTNEGWICVTAGNPGTWRSFGLLT